MSLSPGSRLGVFEVLSILGRGGMGEVYRARDTRLARDVALKVLPDAEASDLAWRTRFEREARALASLNHPNIAAIYGLEESASAQTNRAAVTAIVMELVDGETLADRLRRGPLALDESLGVAGQIADALDAAHHKGIVHRDLKWLAYYVLNSNTFEVYATPYREAGTPWLIAEGTDPSWGPDGNEIYYRRGPRLMAARVDKAAGVKVPASRVVVDKRIRFLSKSLDRAVVVDNAGKTHQRVHFGATVTILPESGDEREVTIVGVDELDSGDARVSWRSPLGRALLTATVGDTRHSDATRAAWTPNASKSSPCATTICA